MNDSHIDTLEKVRQFLNGTDELDLAIDGKKNRYGFIKHTLMRFKYNTLSRSDKGLVLRYIARISSYSHAQIKRLAADYRRMVGSSGGMRLGAGLPGAIPIQTASH